MRWSSAAVVKKILSSRPGVWLPARVSVRDTPADPALVGDRRREPRAMTSLTGWLR